MRVVFVFALLSLCVACERPAPPPAKVYVGERAVEVVSKVLKDKSLVPSIKAAYLVAETIGDGEFGPSDQWVFMRLDITPSSLSKWTTVIEPLAQGDSPRFASPKLKAAWWPLESPLPTAQVVGLPTIIKGPRHGWAAISADGARVYLYSYTM